MPQAPAPVNVAPVLVRTIVAYGMKYRLGYEDEGWRDPLGVEVVEGVGFTGDGRLRLGGRVVEPTELDLWLE